MIYINEEGGLYLTKITNMSATHQNHILLILLILKQLPIVEDLHWYILGMLHKYDIDDVYSDDEDISISYLFYS